MLGALTTNKELMTELLDMEEKSRKTVLITI